MTLIKSISGIRGTIGGAIGDNLTPVDIVECAAGFGQWVSGQQKGRKIVIGRDARISGSIVNALVVNTLLSMGFDIIDLGLSTTPSVEMAVVDFEASAGIILTASHNPVQWNALKFLNHKGEFISAQNGTDILNIIAERQIVFSEVHELGKVHYEHGYIDRHIDHILNLPLVNADKVRAARLTIVVDCVNSTGAISVVPLLERLGCKVIAIHDEMTGNFAHNPEPLPEHLADLSHAVVVNGADMGISVDPDVDRLAFVCEDGTMFSEEYTLVAVADYILGHKKGATVSNLSSTRALKDVSDTHGVNYHASAVGEVNVVVKMKETGAVIGGEGNGGIIYPELHYGRDALVGIALFLTHFVEKGISMTELKNSYPVYFMHKDKMSLDTGIDMNGVFEHIENQYAAHGLNKEDGLKIDLNDGWVHLRRSNTEPIIRIYTESYDINHAKQLAKDVKDLISEFLN